MFKVSEVYFALLNSGIKIYVIIKLQLQSEHGGARNKVAAAKAKNFLKILTSKDGVYFLHFLWDLTTCLAKVSKVFQDRMTTVGQIHTELTAAKAVLESFKTRCIL